MSADKDCWDMLRRGQMEEKEIPEGHDLRTMQDSLDHVNIENEFQAGRASAHKRSLLTPGSVEQTQCKICHVPSLRGSTDMPKLLRFGWGAKCSFALTKTQTGLQDRARSAPGRPSRSFAANSSVRHPKKLFARYLRGPHDRRPRKNDGGMARMSRYLACCGAESLRPASPSAPP